MIVDLDTLHWDILLALPSDPIATKYISTDGQWSMNPNSLLLLDNRIYVPSAGSLHTHVLQYNHDHILARHYSQNKTLKLVHHRYSWPSLCADVQHSVSSHVTSDRGLEFVSDFFLSLSTALDMWLHFTSGYHPEGDGQTKHMNQTLKQYLCVYCNYQQDN